MTDDDFKKDREARTKRQENVNSTLIKAMKWIRKKPEQEDGTVLELSLLTSNNVPDVDEEYDATIVQATIDQEEVETIERIQTIEDRSRDVSPEPEKRPGRQTSTPRQSDHTLQDKRRVTFDQRDRVNTIRPGRDTRTTQQMGAEVGNGAYDHPGYNPRLGELEGTRRGGIPHLKPHELQYYRLQNYQTEVPLFPLRQTVRGIAGALEDAIKKSAQREDDGPLTQTLENLSNNLAIQYAQPGVNEKVPQFDGDYTYKCGRKEMGNVRNMHFF